MKIFALLVKNLSLKVSLPIWLLAREIPRNRSQPPPPPNVFALEHFCSLVKGARSLARILPTYLLRVRVCGQLCCTKLLQAVRAAASANLSWRASASRCEHDESSSFWPTREADKSRACAPGRRSTAGPLQAVARSDGCASESRSIKPNSHRQIVLTLERRGARAREGASFPLSDSAASRKWFVRILTSSCSSSSSSSSNRRRSPEQRYKRSSN